MNFPDHDPVGAVAGLFPSLPTPIGPSYLLLCVDRSDQRKQVPDPLGLEWFQCVCGTKVKRRPEDVFANRVRFCGDGCRFRSLVVGSRA